jgi:hypothetical protein
MMDLILQIKDETMVRRVSAPMKLGYGRKQGQWWGRHSLPFNLSSSGKWIQGLDKN